MKYNQIKDLYKTKKNKIIKRLKDFERLGINGTNEEIFSELVFCLLTPQSKARVCWHTVEKLSKKKLLCKGKPVRLAGEIKPVRFHNNKARYIVGARKLFSEKNKIAIKSKLEKIQGQFELRKWLVENIKGIGYKEASHFLRNIGLGGNMAILDRHILRNLKEMYVIEDVPKTINRKTYLCIENKMKQFAKKIRIPVSHLDLLFWAKETGEIFK